jgi:aspartate carbamoyltransferase regulatory subunit
MMNADPSGRSPLPSKYPPFATFPCKSRTCCGAKRKQKLFDFARADIILYKCTYCGETNAIDKEKPKGR